MAAGIIAVSHKVFPSYYIRLYDADGNEVNDFIVGNMGNWRGQIIAKDTDGNVYVLEDTKKRISKYDQDGNQLVTLYVGERIYSIIVHDDGYIYTTQYMGLGLGYVLYKRDTTDLSEVSLVNFAPDDIDTGYGVVGLALDNDYFYYIYSKEIGGYVWVERRYLSDGDGFSAGDLNASRLIDIRCLATYKTCLAIVNYTLYGTGSSDWAGWHLPKTLDVGAYLTPWVIVDHDLPYHLTDYKHEDIFITGHDGTHYVVGRYNSNRVCIWQKNVGISIRSVAAAPCNVASGKSSITTSVIAEMTYITIETVRAYRSGAFTRMELTGDIKKANNIFKRGFEYIVQDEEPDEEAEGTEIIEESEEEFETGEYTLNDYDEELPLMYRNPLYQLEEDTIFWFRAIAYTGEEKETSNWMKNVPTMTTSECTETTSFSTKGNGELTNIGANIVTKRGFYLIKEFSGSIFNIRKYTFHGFSILYLTPTTLYNPDGTLMGFAYEGELAKIVYTKDIYGHPLGEYELGIGTGILDSIYPGDNYKVKAFGENQLGRGFGEEVLVATDPVISEPNTEYENPGGEDNEPTESPTTTIKTVKVDNLPGGWKVVRMGIKYSRTPSCNEGIVYEDGEWNNGEGITLFITDLIPGEKYYEAPFVIIEDDSGAQDEIEEIPGDNWDDEFPPFTLREWEDFPDIKIPLPDLVGIDYETIIKEIKCSIIADQSIIDKHGRRRTLIIKNNLIQTKEFCISIRDNYLNRFQEVKLKIDINYDIPLPFEREDTVLLAYGQINYKTDANGVIEAKADGEGIISGKMSILTKIRKINIDAKAGEAILGLELEV